MASGEMLAPMTYPLIFVLKSAHVLNILHSVTELQVFEPARYSSTRYNQSKETNSDAQTTDFFPECKARGLFEHLMV